MTRIADDDVSDELWDRVRHHVRRADQAQLVFAITVINAWNRLCITTRAQPGHYEPGTFGERDRRRRRPLSGMRSCEGASSMMQARQRKTVSSRVRGAAAVPVARGVQPPRAASARPRTSCRRRGSGSRVSIESAIRNLRAWLTTVVSRLALDALTSARARRERYVGPWLPEPIVDTERARRRPGRPRRPRRVGEHGAADRARIALPCGTECVSAP